MSVTKVPMRGVNTAVDTAAGDDANIGYTAAEGLILTGQGSTDDITIKNDADTTVVNVATGSTDIEISAGDLLFGTAGKGVCLGVTTNTDSNTLDDYEEGYLTATLSGGTSGNFVLDSATLAYTKVGRVVHLQGFLTTSSDSSTSGEIVLNLPFTSATLTSNSDNQKCFLHMDNHGDGGIENSYLAVPSNLAVSYFANVTDTGGSESIDESRLDAAWRCNVNLNYIAA